MKGLQDNGVMATAKHFPGHGDVAVDSHNDIPVINKTKEQLAAMELAPFKALIDAGIESVMVGHLSVPAIDNRPKYATSLSEKAINELLKKEMGFKGITVTDALDMKAISNYFPKGEANVQAILAGNDMLCLPGDIGQSIDKIKEAIQEGRLSEEDINNFGSFTGLLEIIKQRMSPPEIVRLYEEVVNRFFGEEGQQLSATDPKEDESVKDRILEVFRQAVPEVESSTIDLRGLKSNFYSKYKVRGQEGFSEDSDQPSVDESNRRKLNRILVSIFWES
jgi:hypothetical protein